MFDRISERVKRVAERRARARAAEFAERLGAELPRGMEAEAVDGGVRLSGRGARRRLALEPALRRLMATLR